VFKVKVTAAKNSSAQVCAPLRHSLIISILDDGSSPSLKEDINVKDEFCISACSCKQNMVVEPSDNHLCLTAVQYMYTHLQWIWARNFNIQVLFCSGSMKRIGLGYIFLYNKTDYCSWCKLIPTAQTKTFILFS